MLDDPNKTGPLLLALKAAVPFEVEPTPSLVRLLRAEHAVTDAEARRTVTDLSYAGDEGGIVCHLASPDGDEAALFVSLTHVRVPASMPLAAAVARYQKHRVKKLKKQGQA